MTNEGKVLRVGDRVVVSKDCEHRHVWAGSVGEVVNNWGDGEVDVMWEGDNFTGLFNNEELLHLRRGV
jgi:hypothetical protein